MSNFPYERPNAHPHEHSLESTLNSPKTVLAPQGPGGKQISYSVMGRTEFTYQVNPTLGEEEVVVEGGEDRGEDKDEDDERSSF